MKLLLLVFLLLSAPFSFANSTIIRSGLGANLNEYLKRLEGFGFSGQLLILKNHTIVLHSGYGLADRKDGIPVTTETLFEIASISKQFTAAAILKLEMLGKLKVSHPVSMFYPEAPSVWKEITLHDLLTHTARLEDDYAYYSRHPHLERNAYVRHILNSRLLENREMIYSNDGYALLAAIVEKVSGGPFEEFVTRELFQPAGMEDSGFITRPGKILRPLAIGYGGTRSSPGPNWQNIGSTGIVSHAKDLYRWYSALQSNRVLSEEAREKFFAAHVKTDLPFDYGYGWWIENDPESGKVVWHSGNANSFSGVFRWSVDQQMLIILLTNFAFADFPGREVLFPAVRMTPFRRILQGDPTELPPRFLSHAAIPLVKLNGTYRFMDGSRVFIAAENGALTVLPRGQLAFDRFHSGSNEDKIALHEFTKKTESLLKSLSAGKPESLKELTGDKEAFPGGDTFDVFWENWTNLQKKYGSLISTETLGTTIVYRTDKTRIAETVTLQTYEKGKAYYRWIWNGDHLSTALQDLPLPVIPPFQNQSENRFVNFHLFLHTSANLEFEVMEGNPVALSINGERALRTE